jgi:RNA polymerase sigma-70 factor (ECF subfamily)
VVVLTTKKLDELSDVELLRIAADGDGRAASLFFKRFHDPVLGFLSRLVGRDDPDLDDLVQATFLAALDSANRFEGRSQLRTWLLGIAANKARTHRRGAGRRSNALSALAHEKNPLPPTPSDGVRRKQLIERVSAAIETLPDLEREAFMLCDVEGLGGVGAAETVGVRQGTMWRRLHDARKKLRTALSSEQ